MNDVIERLAHLGTMPLATPDDMTIRNDLRRGQRRLQQRHIRNWAVAAGVVCAITAGGTAAALTSSDGSPRHPVAGSTAAPQVRLVAYHGKQQTGFIVTQVPQGYVVQGSNRANLAIARPSDNSSTDVFVNKINVALLSVDATPDVWNGRPVTINGHAGAIRESADGVRTLEYNDGRHEIQMQVWSNINLTNDQLVALAESIIVTSEAIAPRG